MSEQELMLGKDTLQPGDRVTVQRTSDRFIRIQITRMVSVNGSTESRIIHFSENTGPVPEKVLFPLGITDIASLAALLVDLIGSLFALHPVLESGPTISSTFGTDVYILR